MKILSSASGGASFQCCDGGGETDNNAEMLKRALTDVLLSENLIVLTGLGTSLCVKDTNTPLAPTMGKLWEAVKVAVTEEDFAKARKEANYEGNDNENIEEFLTRCQMAESLNPCLPADFIKKAEKAIAKAVKFLKDDGSIALPHHEMFLRKVGRRSARLPRLKLFTTNYDLCFERAASRLRFVVVDGFSHSDPQEFDGSYFDYDLVRRHADRDVPDYISNVFHLYKIHGSVDWERKDHGRIVKNRSCERPLLIYPRGSKYEASYEPPFLEMMSRLQTALRKPNTGLLVIGFGFNDNHVSQPILAAVSANVSLKAVFVGKDYQVKSGVADAPKEGEPAKADTAETKDVTAEAKGAEIAAKETSDPALVQLAKLIAGNDPRLAIIDGTFEELVAQLPDLVAATEEEEHIKRIAAMRGVK